MFPRSSAAPAARRAHGLRSTLRVGRRLWAALALAAAPAVAGAQGASSTAPIRYSPLDNQAVATYLHDGVADSAFAGAMIVVARQAALSLTGSFTVSMAPGQRRAFPHQLTNRGTSSDVVSLAATASAGWTVALYQDVDGNGRLSAADLPVGATVTLAPGASLALLLVVDVPAAAVAGSSSDLTLSAVSGADARATVSATDHVTVAAAPAPDVRLTKVVDNANATLGDTLRYTISWTNAGDGDAPAASLDDTLPAGLRLLAGTLRLDGTALTDSADADAGTTSLRPDGRGVVHVALGTVTAGASGTLTLSAVVTRTATAGSIANLATLAFGDTARTVAASAATTARTVIGVAALTLSERLLGSSIVTVGAPVVLRLSYGSGSTTAARNAVLVDTLPLDFLFVSSPGATATPATSPAGARIPQVVTWTLGTLAAGSTGTVDLAVQVASRSGAAAISDHAILSADNAPAAESQATATVALFMPNDLRLTKTAAVLEAGIGDAVPYTLVVKNTGIAVLNDVVLRDRLPDGLRYAASSLSGTDSVVVNGQDLAFFLRAPLAPDASATVRYAAIIATPAAGASLVNRAMAEAEHALVASDTARAIVTQRGTLAMRERTMIGKVWLDRNADGVQQPGEEGVAGVQVWDANGDFAVTDKEGRYSFRNVATGTHALRLDPAGIPRDFVLPARSDEVITVHADGWSLPSTNIRLVPRAGAVAAPCTCETAAKAATVSLAGAPVPAAPATVAAPVVAPLVSAADRAMAGRRALIEGEGLRVVAPADGTVLATPRFFAGVRGPAGVVVGLFDGDSLLRQGTLRGDGAQDFLNVELKAGPHHLRVAGLDSTVTMHGDSIAMHISGAPRSFVSPAEVPVLRRDATQASTVRIQVLDQWNVPVANRPLITVAARGAVIAASDEDASSVGLQLRADAAGFVTVPLKAGFQVGAGELRVSAPGARDASVPVRIFSSVRPLVVTGIGQVGVGGAPASFGAVTMQGAVSQNTSVTVSYDSRRAAAGDFFARGFDPYGDEQYPLVGDNSVSGGVAPTTRAVSARVEHGMDWLAAGDVQTNEFGRTGELGAYRRSLTGVTGRLGTGALTWNGFGSMTQQALERTQLRGDGSTGPYLVGSAIRAGTDVIAIEVRARDNAARVVTRQVLGRVTDYQIDYATGAVLLRLPVPATDGYGNPVFVVATVERLGGGAAHFVGGVRLDADAARLLPVAGLFDSLTIGLSGVRDDAAESAAALPGATNARMLYSADLRLRRGTLALGSSVLRAQTVDSTGLATSATAHWAPAGDQLLFDASWMSVGQGMGGTDPRLAAALTATDLSLTAKFSATSSLRMHRSDSRFTQFGVTRATTGVTAEQLLQGHKVKQDLSLVSEGGGVTGASSALMARVSTSVTDRVETWVDGTHSLTTPLGGVAGGRPDQLGTGLTFLLPAGLKLDASHRVMRTPGDSLTYGVTSAQLRAEGVLGGQVWTGFEESTTGLHDEVRAGHSALLGWNQALHLGGAWQLTSLYERRFGLSRASLAEPERAMPFAQVENDRWSAALGLGWAPGGDRARFLMNAEMQDGQGVRSSRFQLSGDAAINAGLAVLALNDWAGRFDGTQGAGVASRNDRSLLGLAMRPVTSTRFNALTKLEWRRTTNPLGATLVTSSARDLRLIASSDVVWTPARGSELSVRYAMRMTTNDVAGDSAQRVRVGDHFAGARMDQHIAGALHLRADGRLLMETESHTALWNAAPSVLYDVQGRLTLEAGYRFGGLRDPDFAAVGGAGAFATVGFRFTEGSLATPAAFWRERIANDR